MARSKGKIMVISAPDLAGSTLTCDVCNAVLLIDSNTPWWATHGWIEEHDSCQQWASEH